MKNFDKSKWSECNTREYLNTRTGLEVMHLCEKKSINIFSLFLQIRHASCSRLMRHFFILYRPLVKERFNVEKTTIIFTKCMKVPKDEFPSPCEKKYMLGIRMTEIYSLNKNDALERLFKAVLEDVLISMTEKMLKVLFKKNE